MQEKRLKTTQDFHDFVVAHHTSTSREKRAVFRGVPKATYELIPSLGRPTRNPGHIRNIEDSILWLFKVHAPAYLNALPTNNWEWLALAQHHGVPTRLLDWTLNAWAALFFAVSEDCNDDCAIYVTDLERLVRPETQAEPWEAKEVVGFIPPHISRRIGAQQAIHTVHPDPRVAWDSANIVKLILPADEKEPVRWALEKMGITAASIFPDLGGVGGYLSWLKGFQGRGPRGT